MSKLEIVVKNFRRVFDSFKVEKKKKYSIKMRSTKCPLKLLSAVKVFFFFLTNKTVLNRNICNFQTRRYSCNARLKFSQPVHNCQFYSRIVTVIACSKRLKTSRYDYSRERVRLVLYARAVYIQLVPINRRIVPCDRAKRRGKTLRKALFVTAKRTRRIRDEFFSALRKLFSLLFTTR